MSGDCACGHPWMGHYVKTGTRAGCSNCACLESLPMPSNALIGDKVHTFGCGCTADQATGIPVATCRRHDQRTRERERERVMDQIVDYLRNNAIEPITPQANYFIYPDRGSFWWKLNFYRGDWGRAMRWALNGFRYRRMMSRRRDRR